MSRFTNKTNWPKDEQDQPAVGLFCIIALGLAVFFMLSVV